MKTRIAALFVLLALACAVGAAPETFNFKDPKGVNNVGFTVDAPLEAIHGNANGVSGMVTFDPESPGSTSGRIVVSSASLKLPNPMQQQHLHSSMWLDSEKNPEIVFEAKELKNVKTEGNVTTADVSGTFTLKGISKDMTVPVKFTYLKDRLQDRVPNMKGDLLVIRSNFSIQRSDFNIMPHKMEDKVSDDIDLTLSIAGAAAK